MKLFTVIQYKLLIAMTRDALMCTKSTYHFLGYKMLHNYDKYEQFLKVQILKTVNKPDVKSETTS